jgi:epoxyqueuosine reductase QueG
MMNKVKKQSELTSDMVKEMGLTAGADIVGIANVGDFSSAPEGFRPFDYMDECISVIVLGCAFSEGALLNIAVEYKEAAGEVTKKVEKAATEMMKQIKQNGYKAKSISSAGGKYIECNPNDRKELFGHISLKHAAELSGIGVIGRNYLLINSKFGNLLWLSAVLTNADLTPDKKVENNLCDNCLKCVGICPVRALDNLSSFNKKDCSRTIYKMVDGKWEFACFLCRKICPNRFGKNKESLGSFVLRPKI